MFLTRLPAGTLPGKVPTLAEAAWAFPLAGIVIGAISGVVYLLASLAVAPLPAAILAMATSALVTGALHEDGLADLADGFGGGTDRSEKLEIMRDSRIGSYGVVALILVLGLTATAMAEAASFVLFLTIGAGTRAAMVAALAVMPAARADGLGQSAVLKPGPDLAVALAIPALLALSTGTLVPLLAVVIPSVAVAALALRQIGGQTGDVMGAIQKLGETGAWLTAAAIAS